MFKVHIYANDYIYPRKILLEEFKRFYAQSGILNNLNEKPNKLRFTKDN